MSAMMDISIITRTGHTIFKLLFVIVVFNIVENAAQWAVEDDGCRTPDRGVGTCIPIKECAPIIEVLTSPSLTDEMKNKIRDYRCGVVGNSVKVCCPPNPILVNAVSIPSEPPDVSRHRNFNLLPNDCGRMDTDDKILNGENATLFEFPWMVLLSYRTRNGPDFKCGGTILNNRYILTAAHCISNLSSPLLGVRVGEHTISSTTDCEKQPNGKEKCADPVQDLRIEQIIPHPDYNKEPFSNDIGLLRVAPIDLKRNNAKPICMPTETIRNQNFEGKRIVVTGWGATESSRNSQILQKVDLLIVPEETCKKTYMKQAKITKNQLCAGGSDRKDSCPGDSGGPMHTVALHKNDIRTIQLGIVSFGPKFCGIEGLPGVYTRIDYFMDWILDNIRR